MGCDSLCTLLPEFRGSNLYCAWLILTTDFIMLLHWHGPLNAEVEGVITAQYCTCYIWEWLNTYRTLLWGRTSSKTGYFGVKTRDSSVNWRIARQPWRELFSIRFVGCRLLLVTGQCFCLPSIVHLHHGETPTVSGCHSTAPQPSQRFAEAPPELEQLGFVSHATG